MNNRLYEAEYGKYFIYGIEIQHFFTIRRSITEMGKMFSHKISYKIQLHIKKNTEIIVLNNQEVAKGLNESHGR